MKKIAYIVLLICSFLLITVNLLSYFNISFFGFRIFKVASGSMEPYLNINDVILIKKANNYEKGDVITYLSDDEYITHRIVTIDFDEIVTKGDANNTLDEPIKVESVKGKVIYKFRYLGFLNYLFSKPMTLIMVLIMGITLLAIIPNKKKGE